MEIIILQWVAFVFIGLFFLFAVVGCIAVILYFLILIAAPLPIYYDSEEKEKSP